MEPWRNRKCGGRRYRRLATLCCLLVLFGVSYAAGDDYLTPELRRAVDELKADAARTPTTRETATARASVLWSWANASAMAGRSLPVNLPPLMRTVRSPGRAPFWVGGEPRR